MVIYNWERQDFLRVEYFGTVTGDDLIRSSLDMAGDPRFDYTHYVLGDWSRYQYSTISQEDVRTLIAIMKSVCMICPLVKNATVIRPDRTGNALVAFYKMLGEDLPWDIEIFHSFEDAYDWFGLPLPQKHKQTG